ncbi:uncharacterized protein C8Q71DRAFT_716529 [Rhodofomes roseus]|uniref:Transposase n=1 Tax=Rhodofomes roseus TaxID=34475 RepID=A0ABQ8K1L2_9APHY|nr:uncharacterized protein C8Q71DRAFT_716529 [Rhodofomes roseus]KAH9830558.1 hypothetical protein C8Q71DRAFT_716529 [Rhodofomes roseus]
MARYNGNRRSVPTPTKELIVYMLAFLRPKKVARYLGLSTRTVFRVYALWASTGSVMRERLQDGRPRKLNGLDAAYLESCVARTPDIYLDELQDMLFEGRQVLVSIATIERTLCRRGWTRKTVS